MVRVSAVTCLIAGGIPTSMGLRAGSTTLAPHISGPKPWGDGCGLPLFPTSPDDTSAKYPCDHADLHSMYMSAWWNVLDVCFDECYLNKQIYTLEDHSSTENYCGAMPKTGCFNGRGFADCLVRNIEVEDGVEGAVSRKCNLALGSALWHVMKEEESMDVCQEDLCDPNCNYKGYNLIDLVSGSLIHHLAICRMRPIYVVQHEYKFPSTPAWKRKKIYEDKCVADECGTEKSSTEASAKTKSSNGTMAGTAVLKHILEETLKVGDAEPAIEDMLAKLG